MAARLLGADQAKVLDYANSGDVAGSPRNRVVGYSAVAIYRSRASQKAASAQAGQLNAAQQQRLLTLARSALQRYLTTGERLEVRESDPALLRPAATFVTLRVRGQLRGCIGTTEPQAPLCQAVRDNAIAAGCYDPRFRPVARAELNDLEIEISVLSPLRKVRSADEIRLPQHGVVVMAGSRRGVFLPQVATETGWSREEFLNHLCADKAGLSPDAWRRGASLYVFTVQAFSSPAPSEQSHGTRPAK
jgi:AmmeMemoRadiSam system protein A